MGILNYWHWLIVLLVVVLIFVLPRLKDQSGKPVHAAGYSVFSSVSVQGKEAEHINEKLPKGWPRWPAYIVSFAVLAASIWLITRP
jgi:hypothetical protein